MLICCYSILVLKKSADQAWKQFENIEPPFVPYRDASYGPCAYELKIIDVLLGIEYATILEWYNPMTFNYDDYTYYEQVQNGDFNWIIPEKFLAFSCPSEEPRDSYGNR